MTQRVSIRVDEDEYEYFQELVEDSTFDDVEEYLGQLITEYYDHRRSKQTQSGGQTEERDLDQHLEALGYK